MQKLSIFTAAFMLVCLLACAPSEKNSKGNNKFKVVAFFTAREDRAHITFVHEANRWFSKQGKTNGFEYDSTNDWSNLNEDFLKNYQVVLFLDTRPDTVKQRVAFENYMKNGGGWMGFHFAGFALDNSDFPQNWDWYHKELLGVGQYKSNTWRPTTAVLRVENKGHELVKNLPDTFRTARNEWYRWEEDLRKNPNFTILASIDSSSFPLGTGPKPNEIWHEGYYPIVWTNKNYNMIYMNMGHDDIDYEGGTNRQLSSSFESELQNKLIIDGLKWLASKQNRGTD